MLIFDEKRDLKDGVWREYAPGVRAKLRPCTKSDFRRLRKEATVKPKRQPGQKRRVPYVDEDLLDRLVLRHVIMDWEGIVDPRKKPIPCTPEKIDLICDRVPDFGNWAVEESDALTEDLAVLEEDEQKN